MLGPPSSADPPGSSSRRSFESVEGSDGVGEGGRQRSNGFQAAQKYGDVLRKMKAIEGMYMARLQECRREVQMLSEKKRTERISSGEGFHDDDFNEAMNEVISLIEARNKQVTMSFPLLPSPPGTLSPMLCFTSSSPLLSCPYTLSTFLHSPLFLFPTTLFSLRTQRPTLIHRKRERERERKRERA